MSLVDPVVRRPRRSPRRAVPAGFGAALLAIAGCTPAPRQAPTAQAVPPPRSSVAAPAAAAGWRDRPFTPGTWAYRQDARGSIALFGPAGVDALLLLRCDRGAGTLYLSRAGTGTAPLVVRTDSMARTLAVSPTGGTPAYVAVALAPRDPLLDAIGFSRGRFAIEQAGAPILVVPPWAEVERVVEDCRG